MPTEGKHESGVSNEKMVVYYGLEMKFTGVPKEKRLILGRDDVNYM